MPFECRRERAKPAHHRRFWFLRAIGAHRANGRLVAFRHVRICVPQPLNRSRSLHERHRELPLEERRFALQIAPGHFIQVQFTLQAGLLDQHRFAGLLGDQRIPQNSIVLPPGMIGGKVHRRTEERRRQTVHESAFILSHGNQLLRTGPADLFTQARHPLRKTFLRKKRIVINFQRVVPNIRSARRKFHRLRQGNRPLHRVRQHIPGGRERGAIRKAFRQPFVPARHFRTIFVGQQRPQMF